MTLPTTLRLTSYLAGYANGDSLAAPITYWTTLADAEALAWERGRNPTATSPTTLDKALGTTDPLLVEHLDKSAKWPLRSSVPGSLTSPLGPSAWSALPELALNQLAATIASGAKLARKDFSAPALVLNLLADLASDGQLDGRGASGQLATPGNPAYAFSAETTRGELAHALDDFMQSPANTSAVSRSDLLKASVYDSMALDVSALYPESEIPPAFVIDDKPGTITVVVWAGGAVKGAQVQIVAIDPTTGLVLGSRPDAGVLGTAGPTDDAGRAAVKLKSAFSGVVQVVALGGQYVDPTDGKTSIVLPATLPLTSYLAAYANGVNLTAPVTLWTTIADAAGLAYALGRNPSSSTPMALDAALALTDVLLTEHFDAKAGTWKLRRSIPGSLALPFTAGSYAAMPEIALNELARQIAVKGGLEVGKGFAATNLVADLLADLGAGGQYDGKGASGVQRPAGTSRAPWTPTSSPPPTAPASLAPTFRRRASTTRWRSTRGRSTRPRRSRRRSRSRARHRPSRSTARRRGPRTRRSRFR